MADPFIVDGKQRGRPGRFIVDYRDPHGRRKWRTFKSKDAAEAYRVKLITEHHHYRGQEAVEDFDITFAEYADRRWLPQIKATVKPRTYASYADTVKLHLTPVFGKARVRHLSRARIKAFLVAKLSGGLARNSVRIIHATLRALLNAATDDGLLLANPATRLGRQLRLAAPPRARQEAIKAMTREQLGAFLEATRRVSPAYVPLFATLAGTGMRLGEALGLQWQDLDFAAKTIRVQRAISGSEIQSPKSGHGRDVQMSVELAQILQRAQMRLPARMKKHKWKVLPLWLFCTRSGKLLEAHNVRKVFRKCLTGARLPDHFTPHCLRHTFASVLLQEGESVQYVQEQLGHASITLTADTYGKWLAKRPVRGGVNLLGDVLGSSVGSRIPGRATKPLQKRGEPSRDRTEDPLIKSQVLCQLS
jgi:integrase